MSTIREACPKCGAFEISGLMGAFWVQLNEEGEPAKPWSDYASETELGTERLCRECDHTWDNDGIPAPSLPGLKHVIAALWTTLHKVLDFYVEPNSAHVAGERELLTAATEALEAGRRCSLGANAELLVWTAIDTSKPETLPNDGESVLGFNENWGELTGLCYLEADEWHSGEGFTMSDDPRTDIDLQPPTHWAPWPQGPNL